MKQAAYAYALTAALDVLLLAWRSTQEGFGWSEVLVTLVVVASCLGTSWLLQIGLPQVRRSAFWVSSLLSLTCMFFSLGLAWQLVLLPTLAGVPTMFWCGLAGLATLGIVHAYAGWKLLAARPAEWMAERN